MRVAAFGVCLALMGWVLVGSVHAADGNIFRAQDVRELEGLLAKVSRLSFGLSITPRRGRTSPPAEAVCGEALLLKIMQVNGTMGWVKEMVLISSRMRFKEEQAIVNTSLKRRAIAEALIAILLCPQRMKEVREMCAGEPYLERRALELAQLCSEGRTLLGNFQDRLRDY